MTTPRYVQHVSGQGEKWEVIHENDNEVAYLVKGKRLDIHPDLRHYLPKSEFKLCDPPEVWEDVTADCTFEALSYTGLYLSDVTRDESILTGSEKGYRLCKVQVDIKDNNTVLVCNTQAFIVERRK